MVRPTGKEQIDLSEETQHWRNATQRKQAKTEAEGDQGILLVKPRIIRNSIASCADREEDDAGEGPQVHEQVGRHVQNHGRETVLGAADHADHHEAGLADRAVGQHALHRGLGESNNVAQGHAQHRQNGEQQFPLIVKGTKATHQDAKGQGESGRFGTHGKERHHRGW